MKNIFVTLVPLVASMVAVAVVKNNKEKEGTAKPQSQSGYMPIGGSRNSDTNSLDGTMSFWQLEPHRMNIYQL